MTKRSNPLLKRPIHRRLAHAINPTLHAAFGHGPPFPHRIQGLYGITPDRIPAPALLAMVEAAIAGGVDVLQYRCKSLSRLARKRQAQLVGTLCRKSGVTFIINDDVTLAAEIGADGVHLGREDGALSSARQILGPEKIIGISCYNELAVASAAAAGGADYIAFGSFFASPTKPEAAHAETSLIVEAKRRFSLPIVAIGGITLENAPQLIKAGVDAIAVISNLFDAVDVAAQAKSYKKLFANHVR